MLQTSFSSNFQPDNVWESDRFGGHSRDFQSIFEPIDWDSLLDIEPHERQKRNVIPSNLPNDGEIRDFIKSHNEPANELIKNVKEMLENNWASTTVRIKSFKSLKNKLKLKNYTLDKIRDTIGLRITLQTVSEVRNMNNFLATTKLKIFEINETRCYGICDTVSVKYSPEGYRRIHLLVKIKPSTFDKWAEIQLGTPYTTMWSDWNHDFLYKGEFVDSKDTSLRDYALDLGEYLYQLDEIRDRMVSCPKILNSTKAKDVLEPAIYDLLGGPSNLCFHWPDVFAKIVTNPSGASRLTSMLVTLNVFGLLALWL